MNRHHSAQQNTLASTHEQVIFSYLFELLLKKINFLFYNFNLPI